jgi:cytochrome b
MNPAQQQPIWDLPIRIFHWLLAASVIGAVVSAKIGGNMMVWHGRLGALILGLLVFRIAWGLWGSDTARFASFVRGPQAIGAYLKGVWHGIGHNPLGALSVLAMLTVLLFQAVSGHFAHDDIAFRGPLANMVEQHMRDEATRLHHLAANLVYVLVALHLLAIVFYARVKKHNLVLPMLTGKGPSTGSSNRGGGRVGLVLALALAGLAVWAGQGGWQAELAAPAITPATPAYDW